MFQKPTFGGNTSGFGSFNAGASTSSPFGGFKPAAVTSAFGAAPAFGAAAAPQPAAGGSFFGNTSTTGGLFGSSAAPAAAPSFGGGAAGGFAFGQPSTAGSSLFGGSSTGGGLFGASTTPQQTTSAFGAKPAGFGFGSTATTGTTGGGLFGATSTGTGLFGQQQTTSMGGGGLFGNTTGGFGQQQQQAGTAHVKYNPVVGTDVMVKSGQSQNISIKHHCITCMKEYEGKSLEELRLEDYMAGRKGGAASAGVFGGAKPLFGGSSAFGQPATSASTAPSVFGAGGSAFGSGGAFAFGQSQPPAAAPSLFGAAKPAFGATSAPGTTSLFGTTTTQAQAPAFGANTSAFGFGANTQNQSTGLFGAKPAAPGFGGASGAFGNMSGGGLFAPRPQQSSAPAFPSAAPAFGTGTTGFGATTSTTGSLFNNSFKPATAPTFGFGATQPTTGLGGGLGGGLGTSFQAKPGGTGFPSLSTSGPSIFGGGQTAPTLNFNTGNTTLGGGLGGGLNLGGSLGMGQQMQANNLSGAAPAGNVHEQILCLAARPYGDSPLFKNLLPDSSMTGEDALKPTNPAAVQAVLAGSNYRVASPEAARLRLAPRAPHHATDKKSLFDGLEESDPSLEDRLSLRPSRKRLVLRPQQNQETTGDGGRNRSPESRAPAARGDPRPTHEPTNGSMTHKSPDVEAVDGRRRSGEFAENTRGVNTDLEDSSERHGSWLGSSKLSWNDSKEKQIEIQSTPKLYPELDKELPEENAERRSSWLTTKPLRKKTVQISTVHQDSVRELRSEVGPDSRVIESRLSESRVTESRTVHDKENIDHLSLSEEENVAPTDAPPHPAGIKLTRPGYYTIPSLDDMISYIRPDGRCVVPHLTIGRYNYGNVFYDGEIDVAGLDLDTLVHFLNKEVIVYPEDSDKPPVGEGLNRRAVVTLDRVWPRDKTARRPVTDPERLMKMDYEGKLRRVCDKHDTKFIEYRPQTGSWVFRVEHFSKYGLTDSDEEDDITPDVLKRQLVNQALQKNASPAQKGQSVIQPAQGLGGLGAPEDSLLAMQQSTLNLLNGAGRPFEMDTTEDNADIASLYPQDSHRAYQVKSPSSELARLEHRRSHNVQLMKASLYADMDMEDDVSVSTGDQLVPQPSGLLTVSPLASPPPVEDMEETEEAPALVTEELPMKPLLVRPHTIVLQYHRKVPPFKETIAGRLDAACLADMSVSRARHSRAGFAAGNALAFVTSRDALAHLPTVAVLSSLNAYVSGRGERDWSAPVVARLTLSASENTPNVQDALAGHLEAMLDFSTLEDSGSGCPRLVVKREAAARRELLERHLREAGRTQRRRTQFGVTGAYRLEVWRLCEALWAAELSRGGVAGAGEVSVVGRHRALLGWLAAAGADGTDAELARPRGGEDEDEADGHSAQIWTLLLGGRIMEACKVARDAGDLHMATLLAQASGDPAFRALVARQLAIWRESGADALISASRRDALCLLAGEAPVAALSRADWLHSLHATARYLCPQVPTLEQVIQRYEGLFKTSGKETEDVDLTVADDDQGNDMQYPLPPYQADYDASIESNGRKRRILDLRYELIRARALNSRPKLQPASYTPDPMDYSLCFVVGAWLGEPSVESICGAAEQLEACGAWHLAAAALAYHPDAKAREHLIRGVLSRHAPPSGARAEAALLQRLAVPPAWLRAAQAARAKYEHKPRLEAEHLLASGQYSAAHRVLLEELLPTTVLADDLESIAPLVDQLNEAAQRHEVAGWESGGQALHHYLHVCAEIRSLVSLAGAGAEAEAEAEAESRSRAGVAGRLEALRPRLRAACRALAALPATTARHAAARAEMGARLLQAALAGGESPARLATLLQALRLPPDCTWHAQLKITTELAQQASESCMESANSSPMSHHHAVPVKGES